jgi:Dolichyl-phosphate-mannose-protein mannosyltransferase
MTTATPPLSEGTASTAAASLIRWMTTGGIRPLLVFIAAHVFVWTIAISICRLPGVLWDDMLETYSWAQHWQLGYYKHPPFYSWVAGAWFQIMPRTDWAFYLLSAVNVGVGFAGVWALATCFLKKDGRLLTVLPLAFMPSYNYLASNFNANTILLSLWPWTTYAFVKSLETRSWRSSVAFGALAAACMLSKYYSILLLATCFLAALAHPNARRYFTSPAPYIAVAVGALLLSPHIWWAFANDWPPIKYALGKTGYAWASSFEKAAGTAFAGIAINLVPAGILITALRRANPELVAGSWRKLLLPERRWILILASGPTIATILLGMGGYVKISIGFLIPAFFMLPLMIMLAIEATITRSMVAGVARAVAMVFCAALLAAPGVALGSFYLRMKGTVDVSDIAARDAAAIWVETFSAPLRIVGGSEKYSIALPFYAPSSPHEFTHFTLDQAPWITPARIAREGILTICDAADVGCVALADRTAHAGTQRFPVTISETLAGIKGPEVPLLYIMTPPVP